MRGWAECCYKLTPREDARWVNAMEAYPYDLCLDIEVSFARGWFLRVVPVATRVLLVLSFQDRGLEPLPDGTLWVPDDLQRTVRQSLRQEGTRGQWWTLRRAHFRSVRAQQAWEALL